MFSFESPNSQPIPIIAHFSQNVNSKTTFIYNPKLLSFLFI